MIARHYISADAEAVDKILGQPQAGDVRLERDRIVVAGCPAYGLLVWRPCAFVHELRTGYGMAQRHLADILVNFAIGDAVSRPANIWEAVFVCDSDDMAKYVEGLGAVEEKGKRVFTLQVRRP